MILLCGIEKNELKLFDDVRNSEICACFFAVDA